MTHLTMIRIISKIEENYIEFSNLCYGIGAPALQSARGVQTCMKVWTESAHCEHYRNFPEEYIAELQRFQK